MKDELTQLIRSINEGPVSWSRQKKLVDLVFDLFEKQGTEHKLHVERLEKMIKNLEENNVIKKDLKIAC